MRAVAISFRPSVAAICAAAKSSNFWFMAVSTVCMSRLGPEILLLFEAAAAAAFLARVVLEGIVWTRDDLSGK